MTLEESNQITKIVLRPFSFANINQESLKSWHIAIKQYDFKLALKASEDLLKSKMKYTPNPGDLVEKIESKRKYMHSVKNTKKINDKNDIKTFFAKDKDGIPKAYIKAPEEFRKAYKKYLESNKGKLKQQKEKDFIF